MQRSTLPEQFRLLPCVVGLHEDATRWVYVRMRSYKMPLWAIHRCRYCGREALFI